MPSTIARRTLLATFATALPLPLRAADPWTRPPASWTDRDIERILTDSPWAKQVSITLSAGMPMGGGGGRRGGRGGAGPLSGGIPDASVGGGSEGGMGGMGGRPGMGEGMGGTMAPSVTFQIRWQSAKPIKLATVRARMGAEADTSPQAREFVEREEPDYVIAVIGPPLGPPPEAGARPGGGEPRPAAGKAGPPGAGRELHGRDPGAWMAALKENTWLAWKNHEKLHPSQVTTPPGGQRGVLIFHFPKDHPIELEDREVEFCMRQGALEVKRKFRLKDMVYEGKLSL